MIGAQSKKLKGSAISLHILKFSKEDVTSAHFVV